jgi:hypothetical protein
VIVVVLEFLSEDFDVALSLINLYLFSKGERRTGSE